LKKFLIPLLMFAFPVLVSGQQFPVFSVNLIEIEGKTAAQTEKMKRAAKIFERVMNDPEFQGELRSQTFKSDDDDDLITDPTAEQVIEKIYAAAELYKPEPNNTADIYWYAKKTGFWRKITDKCDTIGYGFQGQKSIYTYTCLLDEKDSMAKLVGHIAHEWSHKLGFTHRDDDDSGIDLTVPYVFGDLVARHAARWINPDYALEENFCPRIYANDRG